MARVGLSGLLFLVFTFPAYSLDTIEPFETGLSDVELYYGRSQSAGHAFIGTVGVGISRLLNPAVSPEIVHDGEVGWGMGFENIMNVYEGRFGVDLIPGGWTNAEESNVGLGMEMTLPFQGFTPYLQTRVGTHLQDNTVEWVASLGAAMNVSHTGQFFLEVGHKWLPGTDFVRAGIGFNMLVSETTEMISQITHDEEWGAMLGVIQTL